MQTKYLLSYCPKCKAEGKQHRLHNGGASSTLMTTDSFAENGVWHHHDNNRHTYCYICSNKHYIEVKFKYACPAPGCSSSEDRVCSVDIWDEVEKKSCGHYPKVPYNIDSGGMKIDIGADAGEST